MSKFDEKIKTENISQKDIITETMGMLSNASSMTNSSNSDISAMMKGVMGMMSPMLSRQQSDCFAPNSGDQLLDDVYDSTFPSQNSNKSNKSNKLNKKKKKK